MPYEKIRMDKVNPADYYPRVIFKLYRSRTDTTSYTDYCTSKTKEIIEYILLMSDTDFKEFVYDSDYVFADKLGLFLPEYANVNKEPAIANPTAAKEFAVSADINPIAAVANPTVPKAVPYYSNIFRRICRRIGIRV